MRRATLAVLGAVAIFATTALPAVAQIGGAGGQTNPSALRSAQRAAQPVRINSAEGFILNHTPRPDLSTGQGLRFELLPGGPTPRWIITIPYSFYVEGVRGARIRCDVLGADADRTNLGSAERDIALLAHGEGSIVMGVPAVANAGAYPAGSFVCTARLIGVRQSGPNQGLDFEARDVTQPGGPVDVWVKEDGFSQWWTGPGFDRPFRLRVTGTIR